MDTAFNPVEKLLAQEAGSDFSRYNFLVVDAVAEMRTAMAMTLSSFGAFKADFASRSTEAVTKAQRIQYDVILCEFTLTHPFDGLYLLEELKNRNLLKQSTVFIIITSEARAQNVLSAVELAPDDYLLKPFSGEVLRKRLSRAVQKKKVFRGVDEAMLRHDYLSALAECKERIARKDPYSIDFMKLKGRLSLLTGDYPEAKRVYEQILHAKPLAWAQMGLGKALFYQHNYAAAQRVFEGVLGENDMVMEAYDWLAQCQEASGNRIGAQEILQKAVEMSPAIVPRQRHLGGVAQLNQDWDVAAEAFNATIEHARYSFHHDAADYAQLSQSQLAQGNAAAAEKTLSNVRRAFHAPATDLLANVMESQIAYEKGDEARAARAFDAARAQFASLPDLPKTHSIALAQACYVFHDDALGAQIIADAIKNNHDDPRLMEQVETLFVSVGRPDEGRRLIEANAQDIVELNNTAVRLAQEGDLHGAVQHFLHALDERPGNLPIMLNAINALLAFVNQRGWNDEYMSKASSMLHKIQQTNPSNGKFQRLQALHRITERKYGIQRS